MRRAKGDLQEHFRLLVANLRMYSGVEMVTTNGFRSMLIFKGQASGGVAPMEVGAFWEGGFKGNNGKKDKGKGYDEGNGKGKTGKSNGHRQRKKGERGRRKLLRSREMLPLGWHGPQSGAMCAAFDSDFFRVRRRPGQLRRELE